MTDRPNPIATLVGCLLLSSFGGCPDSPPASADTATPADATPEAGDGGDVDDAPGDGGDALPDQGPVDVLTPDITGSGLPAVSQLPGLAVYVDGDRARITFPPLAGAVDYRIFALPDDPQVTDLGDGRYALQDGWFRCGGQRQAPTIATNGSGNAWVNAISDGSVNALTRTEAGALVGYVYITPGPGRTAIHAVGSPGAGADNHCERQRFLRTRVRRFVTASTRDTLLALGWRDDGVAFYAPDGGDVGLTRVTADWVGKTYHVLIRDGETSPGGAEEALSFAVTSTQAADMAPLYRLFIENGCGESHDELIPGVEMFERVKTQGRLPVLELQWAGLTEDTTLVVEALAEGCPNQGHMSLRQLDGVGFAPDFLTVDQVRAAHPYGEVYVNVQFGTAGQPQVIARATVQVSPGDAFAPRHDVAFAFDSDFSNTLTEVDRNTYGGWDLFLEGTAGGGDFAANFYSIEPDMWALGVLGSELWVTYSDWAANTNGKFRFIPKTQAMLADGSFIHATVKVDLWATGRRYPQLWVSSAAAPVQPNMDSGVTLNVQTFGPWATDLQIQVCDQRGWDVNDQCPAAPLEPEPFSDELWPPFPPVNDVAAPARLSQLDLFVSTTRAYLYFNAKPYGCVDLPAGLWAPGAVNVLIGDVLYHSGVDEPVVGSDQFPYLADYQLTATRRLFDHFGFSSAVTAPAWDESVMPCVTLSP